MHLNPNFLKCIGYNLVCLFQISDFGLAKWLPTQWSHHSIAPIEGTFGYKIVLAIAKIFELIA